MLMYMLTFCSDCLRTFVAKSEVTDSSLVSGACKKIICITQYTYCGFMIYTNYTKIIAIFSFVQKHSTFLCSHRYTTSDKQHKSI